MRFDWRDGSPSVHNHINSAPKWQIPVITRNDMREQSHPKRGQRLVINIDSMMRRKATERCSHSRGCFHQRHLSEIAQRHGQMRRMRKLRRGNRRRFESCDESLGLGVAREIARLQGSNRKIEKRVVATALCALRRTGHRPVATDATRADDSLRRWRDIPHAAG